jgi:hypothetical protein
MTRSILCGLVAGALALTGCNKNSTTAPGTNPDKPSSTKKLTVTSPGDQSVVVNNTDKFTVRISRDHFDGPVDVHVKDLPPGVSVVTPDLTIPAGQTSLEVTIKADDKAKPVEKHHSQVAVRAKDQADMQETSVVFDVTVKAK